MPPTTYRRVKPSTKKAKSRNKKLLVIGAIVVVVAIISVIFALALSHAPEYSANSTKILFVTSMGNITIELRNDKPITTGNFVNLVKQGFYDGTTFHRVMAGFMIQGGQNTTVNAATIPDEIGNDNHNDNGTIAMANTGAPNSASSEFFINVANNGQNPKDPTFDSSYTVFGRVTSGMDVVMKISQVPCEANPNNPSEISRPITPVTLISATVLPL